ncbi:hypothetical protein A2U01_0072898, partial [Trifolium medium]|nr:hypothetical protein [Trifolium medium]
RLFEGPHVPDNVGQSSKVATCTMTRKKVIANLKETCHALEERKASLESIINALELEEANEVAEKVANAGADDGDDTKVMETDGSEDI